MHDSPPAYAITRGTSPLVCAAVHDGHAVRPGLLPKFALGEAGRLREEDPHTGVWTSVGDTRIIGQRSRFEVDLNRPPDKAVYRVPEDAWGLDVWTDGISDADHATSMALYEDFYRAVGETLDPLLARHGSLIVYDIHSYNHHRQGPEAPFDDPAANPEVNVGTGNLDRDTWGPTVDTFMRALRAQTVQGRQLDVRENVKFRGGYFSKWIHERYGSRVAAIAVEFKKFFMDEWTGTPDAAAIEDVRRALAATVAPVLASRPRSIAP